MPPKADYWKHFNVVGVVAYCLIAECQQPNVSLGALPKPGEKKRLRKQTVVIFFSSLSFFGVLDVAAVANHLSRHHEEIWLAYVAERDAQAAKKEADKENCEMENPELRFIDMRSRAGQVSSQNQVVFMLYELE